MVLSTEWSQVEVIDLINDGNGLGFILVGGKSTGVVIKALIPGEHSRCAVLLRNMVLFIIILSILFWIWGWPFEMLCLKNIIFIIFVILFVYTQYL